MEGKIEAQEMTIDRFNTFVEAVLVMIEPNLTKSYLEAKLKTVDNMWARIENGHEKLIEGVKLDDRKTINYFKNKQFDHAFAAYDKVTLFIHRKLDKYKPAPPQAQIHLPENLALNKTNIKLKPIGIPSFSGDYKKWISFISMFDSLIHNSTELTKLQKIHYLKSSLEGDAERIISQYNITEEDYDDAYAAIKDRYQNDVVLVNTHIRSIIHQPDLEKETSDGIKNLMDVTNENMHALAKLKIDTKTWDPILLFLLIPKLDPTTKRLWDLSLKPKVMPTLNEFINFLNSRFNALGCQSNIRVSISSSLDAKQQSDQKAYTSNCHKEDSSKHQYNSSNCHPKHQRRNFPPRSYQNFHNSAMSTQKKCPFQCGGSHNLFECERFRSADAHMKSDLVSCAKLCKNCLKAHSGKCALQPGCHKCKKYHHTSLHFENENSTLKNQTIRVNNQESQQTTSSNQQGVSVSSHHAHVEKKGSQISVVDRLGPIAWNEPVLLATAIVLVRSTKDNRLYPFRALLDQASEANYISEYALQFLGLNKKNIFAATTGLGGIKTGILKSVAEFEVGSRINRSFQIKVQAPVVSKVTNPLPSTFTKKHVWNHIKELQLADPEFNVPGKIDLLLGAPVYAYLLLPGLIKAAPDMPVAQNTEFGWILSGGTRSPSASIHTISSFHLRIDLEDQLKRFFEQEEVPKERILTQEEVECEKFFNETVRRDHEGRYEVALPFKSEPKTLGSSKGQAISRLLKLETKFATNKDLKQEYLDILKEYESLGHTTSLGDLYQQTESTVYYLPHHAVFKPESTTTKTRVVFDASAKSNNGVSLNDILMTGPTLQQDLSAILTRWRTHKFIFSADIAKMYRQITVREEDRIYQRFLYRENENESIKEYQHNRVTFGVTSATYLAVKTLQQLALDEKDTYPEASKIILRDFYMDDGMSGTDTIQQGIKICKDLKELLASGKFELRKFISNSPEILESIPEKEREVKLPLEINTDNIVKTLGIHYHPATDQFQFRINIQPSTAWPTKRSLLSESSRLFDPLGWLAPVVIRPKILFRDLWLEGLQWDQKLPQQIAEKWLTFREELYKLESIKINRWSGQTEDNEEVELHGFGDASEKAYAAVVYSRVVNKDGSIKVTMLTAKTRVAPLKTITLPRLELCAAVLVSNLMNKVRKALNIDRSKLHAWSDSTVVLGWLRTTPSKLKTFVANRVVEAHNNLNNDHWYYIKGEKNPADCASRGIAASELINHKLWWNGPQCLYENKTCWEQDLEIPPTTLELRSSVVKSHVVVAQKEDWDKYIENYSDLNHLLRITAFQLRFINNIRKPNDKITNSTLTVRELQLAREHLLRLYQGKQFSSEINKLKAKKNVDHKSNILSLNPFLDEKGLLRVGGRLEESNLHYERKHPIIMSSGTLTDLIISDAHQKCLHGGNKLTMNVIKESYWIISLKWKVKNHITHCVTCFRFKAAASQQIMGILPRTRIVESSPFTHTGVDYAGPFYIKASNVRAPPTRIKATMIDGILVKAIPKVPVFKGYIALFICLATKAIHLEVVSDMTTEAFLAALRRFTARRSYPTDMYSDNGTTFIGAQMVLSDDYEKSLVDYGKVAKQLSSDKIQWHFIPPRASHFGGIWEANIKAMKHHLKRVIADTILTFEELTTIACQIEACLNSRPLCPLTEDSDDLDVLTPGNFLVGRPLIAPPSGNLEKFKGNIRERWRLQQKLVQDIWNAWSKDYLNHLQQRNKWRQKKQNIKRGNIVLLKDDDIPPTRWPLARVTEVYTSRDGNVRVATVRTKLEGNQKFGEYERPITKLCLLPITDNEDSTNNVDKLN